MLAVLPKKLPLIVVGGLDSFSFKTWFDSGVAGFGIGSYLYNNKYSLNKIDQICKKIVIEYDKFK